MTLDGFFRGAGPWWLFGWIGKVFDGQHLRGYNVFKNKPKTMPFQFTYDDEGIVIVYDPPYSRITDYMVPVVDETKGESWKGEIRILGIKIGKFTLIPGERDGRKNS